MGMLRIGSAMPRDVFRARAIGALAEREGFEPSVPRKGYNGFRDRPDRPLWHLSGGNDINDLGYCFPSSNGEQRPTLSVVVSASPLPESSPLARPASVSATARCVLFLPGRAHTDVPS